MLLPIKRVCNSFLANVAQYMDNRIGLRKIEKYVMLIWSITIGHFTVMDGSEADGDLVLIQTFPLYYVNQVILTLTSIFQG